MADQIVDKISKVEGITSEKVKSLDSAFAADGSRIEPSTIAPNQARFDALMVQDAPKSQVAFDDVLVAQPSKGSLLNEVRSMQ